MKASKYFLLKHLPQKWKIPNLILGGDTNAFVRTGLGVCQIKHAELRMVPALCKHVTQTVNKLN